MQLHTYLLSVYDRVSLPRNQMPYRGFGTIFAWRIVMTLSRLRSRWNAGVHIPGSHLQSYFLLQHELAFNMSLNTRKQERDFTAEVEALQAEAEQLAKVRTSHLTMAPS